MVKRGGSRQHGPGVGRARAQQARGGQRGGRSAGPRHRRSLPRLRRRRRAAPRAHSGEIARRLPGTMTDRRRNLFVLLLVAALVAASAVVILSKETRLGLDLKGGVSLTYQAKPTVQSGVTSDAIDRTLDIMRERVDQLGVSEPEIQRSGSDQIDVSLPDVKNADEAADQVGTTAQLFFTDWEKNVLGPNCKPDPGNADVTGGQAAGSTAAALSHYDAVTRASKCPETNRGNETTNGTWYVVDSKKKQVLAGPEEDRKDLRATEQEKNIKLGGDVKEVFVPSGTIVTRAEKSSATAAPPDRWYVLRDDPAL